MFQEDCAHCFEDSLEPFSGPRNIPVYQPGRLQWHHPFRSLLIIVLSTHSRLIRRFTQSSAQLFAAFLCLNSRPRIVLEFSLWGWQRREPSPWGKPSTALFLTNRSRIFYFQAFVDLGRKFQVIWVVCISTAPQSSGKRMFKSGWFMVDWHSLGFGESSCGAKEGITGTSESLWRNFWLWKGASFPTIMRLTFFIVYYWVCCPCSLSHSVI